MRLLFCLMLGTALGAPGISGAWAAGTGEPKVVLASLQPVSGCSDPATPWMKSGCVELAKPTDRITVPCKTKPGMCPVTWGLPKSDTAWPSRPRIAADGRLPSVAVIKPVHRHARLRVRRVAVGAAGQYAPQNTQGRDMARMMGLQAAQMAGSMMGADMGVGIGICTGISFAYMVQDGVEAKERWTPIDVLGNILLSGISCSPIGFILRMAQAKTDQERALALVGGGLGFVNHPIAGMAGQALAARQMLAPAARSTQAAAKPAVHRVRHERQSRVASR